MHLSVYFLHFSKYLQIVKNVISSLFKDVHFFLK